MPSRPLVAGELHLWVFTFADLAAALPAPGVLLSDEERLRAERYRFDDDRRRFVLARGQLRMLLGAYTGLAADHVQFTYGPAGLPRQSPALGCPDVRFNVAHSDSAVAYAFALQRDVGVDLEPLIAPDDALARPESYHRLLAPAELLAVEESEPSRRARSVLRLWVRKEACLKALGSGLSTPPDAVDVSAAPVARHAALRTPVWIVDFVTPGHVGAVAVESECPPRVVRCSERVSIESSSPGDHQPPRRSGGWAEPSAAPARQ